MDIVVTFQIPIIVALLSKTMPEYIVHTAKLTQDAFRELDIHTMRWPANSPDLNPIKNVWAILKSRINKRRPRPLTKQEMADAISEEWEYLQPEAFQAAIDSMPRRVQLVIEAAGGPIRY